MLTLLRHLPPRVRAWFHHDSLSQTRVGSAEPKREVTPSTAIAAHVGGPSTDGTAAGAGTGRPHGADVAGYRPRMFASMDYRVWLVEQDTTRLAGEYLTEAMILAPTEAEALAGAMALADPVGGFGLIVQRRRLRAVDYGPATQPLPGVFPRFQHGDALVLVIGTASDHDRRPSACDAAGAA